MVPYSIGDTIVLTDVNEYNSLRLEVDSMLQGIAGICPKEDSDTICRLLAEKEQLLLDILPLVFLWLQPKSRMWNQLSIERNDKIRLLSLPLMIAMCN